MANQRDPDHTDSTLRPSQDLYPELAADDENTPLLSNEQRSEEPQNDDRSHPQSSAVSSLLNYVRSTNAKKRSCLKRWPSLLALAILSTIAIVILVLGFVAPQVAKQYAQHAANFEPTRLSIDSYTDTGVVVRLQGAFQMDASRVHKKSVRSLGRFGTRIARAVEISQTEVEVSLPGHDGLVLGTALVPSMKLCIINGYMNPIDILVNLEPGPQDDLRQVANEFVEGRFDDYTLEAKADVFLRSGILRLGTQSLSQLFSLQGI